MNYKYGDNPFTVWPQSQMNEFDLTTSQLTKWDDINYYQLHYWLTAIKGRPHISSIQLLCLALASAVEGKDYFEFYYEALEATDQKYLFPKHQLHLIGQYKNENS